jgi:hypothetical protein
MKQMNLYIFIDLCLLIYTCIWSQWMQVNRRSRSPLVAVRWRRHWRDSLDVMSLFTSGFMSPNGPPVPSFLIWLHCSFLEDFCKVAYYYEKRVV